MIFYLKKKSLFILKYLRNAILQFTKILFYIYFYNIGNLRSFNFEAYTYRILIINGFFCFDNRFDF